MVFKSFSALLYSCALLLCVYTTVHAEPEINNGSLSGPVSSSDSADATAPPGWYVANSTPNVVHADGPFNNTGVPWTLSPDGGTYSRLNGPGNPVHQESIGQVVDGFVAGTVYSLNFFQVNHGFYNDRFGDWGNHEGYIALFVDDVLVGQSSPITGPANYTGETVWHSDSISFTAASTSHTIVLQAFTTEPSLDPYAYDLIAYMGVDGVRITSEICNNGVDDDGDGLIDTGDPDCVVAEICNNGVDDDHDGDIDDDDPDCAGPEICDNGIDDDLDGLIDGGDSDCASTDIYVRCLHEPIYPQLGDDVTIVASAIDHNGNAVSPDLAEIFINDSAAAFVTETGQGALARFKVNTGQFSYGCRAIKGTEEATSWKLSSTPILRSVDVGSPNNAKWKAIPVIYNGAIDEKIDIVLFHDDDEYTSYVDPDFLQDVYDLIDEGLFTIPWFVETQWAFNFWIATANTANASPDPDPNEERCQRQPPDRAEEDYAYRDSGAIVHTSGCRDNAGGGFFTIEMLDNRLQVFAHEMGHSPFGLADEYCGLNDTGDTICDGGYYSTAVFPGYPYAKENYYPPYPNLFSTEKECQDSAVNRPYDAVDCRSLTDSDNSSVWWIGEPEYRIGTPSLDQVRDLMQQTGNISAASGPDIDRYKVGDTELYRMNWHVWTKCSGDKEC